jgi:hypothetical protein
MRPSVSAFVQFKHILSVPSFDEQSGVPVAKLRALDNMIERLVSQQGAAPVDNVKITGDNIDSVIAGLRKSASRELINTRSLYPSGMNLEMGSRVNVFA